MPISDWFKRKDDKTKQCEFLREAYCGKLFDETDRNFKECLTVDLMHKDKSGEESCEFAQEDGTVVHNPYTIGGKARKSKKQSKKQRMSKKQSKKQRKSRRKSRKSRKSRK